MTGVVSVGSGGEPCSRHSTVSLVFSSSNKERSSQLLRPESRLQPPAKPKSVLRGMRKVSTGSARLRRCNSVLAS